MPTAKIAHLTSANDPMDVRIFKKECLTLQKAGYKVRIVGPGNAGLEFDEVKISTVPTARNRLERMLVTTWRVYRSAISVDSQLYHLHNPELVPVGIWLKVWRKKVVYDAREDLPSEVLDKPWIPQWLRGSVSLFTKILLFLAGRTFDGVVVVNPKIAKSFPSKNTALIPDYPLLEQFPQTGEIDYNARPPAVVYAGTIEVVKGIKEMVWAIELLPEHLQARLMLAGRFGSPDLQEEVHGLAGWKRVDFLGMLIQTQVIPLLSSARVGLMVYHPASDEYIYAQPTKLFEYMAAGIPVVASDFPSWRTFVDVEGCGILVDPLDPKKIAEAVEWLLVHPVEAERMGQRGRQAVLREYNWESQADKLLRLYDRVLSK